VRSPLGGSVANEDPRGQVFCSYSRAPDVSTLQKSAVGRAAQEQLAPPAVSFRCVAYVVSGLGFSDVVGKIEYHLNRMLVLVP